MNEVDQVDPRQKKNTKEKIRAKRSLEKPPKSTRFGIRLPRRAVLSRRRPARAWESEGPFPQLRALREEDFFFELSTFTEVFHYALLLGSPPLAGSAGFATRDIFQPLGNCWTLLRKFKHCVLHGAPRVGLDTGKRCVFWKVFEKFLRS